MENLKSNVKAASPKPRVTAGEDSVHELVRPFLRENTKDWRERKRISQALYDIKCACDEIESFTDRGDTYDIDEADDSMRNLQLRFEDLFRAVESPKKSDCEKCQGKGYVWITDRGWPDRKENCPECVGNMANVLRQPPLPATDSTTIKSAHR